MIAWVTSSLSALVSSSVWTRIELSPDVVTTGCAGVLDAEAADRLAQRVGVVLGHLVDWAVAHLVLGAAGELDAVVEPLDGEADDGEQHDEARDGVPEPLAADEVDRPLAGVEAVAEPG